MSFFQSSVWRDMQNIVGRDIFEITCGNQTYRGVTRTRRVGPFSFRWHQVLGFRMSDIDHIRSVIRERFSSWNDIFFQIGVVDEILSFPLSEKKSIEPSVVAKKRHDICVGCFADGRVTSRKENMPLATIRTPLQSAEVLQSSYHSGHRRYLKKAQKGSFSFSGSSDVSVWRSFYDVRSAMGSLKSVGIMSWDSFLAMMQYLTGEGVGGLFVLMDGDVVVAGSVVAYWDNSIYYLYGASNRSYGNAGVHILLQHEIMSRGYDQGYNWFDHWGVSSCADIDHHLAGVTRFKERFGGEQIEYAGNIDHIHNAFLYRMMKKRAS